MRDSSERDFEELNVPEKILRVQDLWDRIAKALDDVAPTPAQLTELERRLQAHEENPGEYRSWENLRRRLEGRAS